MAEEEKEIVEEGGFMAEKTERKVEDSTEEPTEETTEETKDKTTEEPQRRTSKTPRTQYICNLCGATVVPEESKTDRGIRYRCPECGKFMKPLTPEEATKRKEEELATRRETEREGRGYEDPYDQMVDEMAKKLHRELLKTPNVSDEKAGAIVEDFREDRVLQESARELYYLIMDYCPKAKPGLLGRVLDRVFSIQDEYSQLLSRVEPPVREGSRIREEIPHLRRRIDRGERDLDIPIRRRSIGYDDEPRRRSRQPMVIYVDGQEVETDYEGYMAYQRFKREDAEERRRDQEHELRMKRLEAEILKITAETGSKTGGPPQSTSLHYEEVTEYIDAKGNLCDPEKAVSRRIKRVPIEAKGSTEERRRDQEHELRMKRLEAEILKITAETGGSKSEPLVKVKVGEEEMEVPANIAPLYLKRDDKELKEMRDRLDTEREERHKGEMKRLEEKIDKKEPIVKVKIGEQEQEVPASVAHLYLKGDDKELKDLESKLEKEREERHKAEMKRLEDEQNRLETKIDNQPSFLEQLEYYTAAGQRLGLRQTGRSTMDVLDSFRGDLQTTAQQILNKIPTPGAEFNPEVTRTPEERRRKAEEIKRRLEKSEEILMAEDELIKSASKVKS